MIIAGGCYTESCESPQWSALMGSGGRSASAVARLSSSVELHTYRSPERLHDLYPIEALGVRVFATPSQSEVAFAYFHPLSRPVIAPDRIPRENSLKIEGATVLRFGFLEGDAVVKGETVVYDPQTIRGPRPFAENGSTANRLAIVLNEHEIRAITGETDVHSAAQHLFAQEGAVAIITKAGVKGALVFTRKQSPVWIPPYYSAEVFKIGSGDVFSAAFAHYWGEAALDAPTAADLASRSTAYYCGSRMLPLPNADRLSGFTPVGSQRPGKVCLLGSVRTLGSRWVLEEARWCLSDLGLDVTAPTLEGQPSRSIESEKYHAALICSDLSDEDVILAAVDLARNSVPVVIFSETGNVIPEFADRTMTQRTNDFPTAIYLTGWAAGKESAPPG
jgi:hypothetical protein